jgi:Predicted membrane-associated, metal-dependent hydrolase
LNKLEPFIGADSLSEIHHFDHSEAIYFTKFFINEIFSQSLTQYKKFILYFVGSIFFYFFVNLFFLLIEKCKSKIKADHTKSLFILFVFVVSTIGNFYGLISMYISHSDAYNSVSKNFSESFIQTDQPKRNIDLIVYIGESTSILNMGLYGYIRNTTPRLEMLKAKDGLLVYKNIFSTHTHTSPSLLEALSFSAIPDQINEQIGMRKRESVVDVIDKNNLDVFLISNQGEKGTWNMASSVIFRSANRSFSRDSALFGNNDGAIARPHDHEYFGTELPKVWEKNKRNKLVFLHSYAGHGGYRDNIPSNYRLNVDGLFTNRDFHGVVGGDKVLMGNVEEYDSAIKYIDYSVSNTINQIKQNKKPVIFIYFSDHGDSAYSGRAHDSSRLVHEMLRVPFIIYFNPAARISYPQLYDKYKLLAETENLATLNQVPSVIFDLLGIHILNPEKVNVMPLVGDSAKVNPILVREIGSGKSIIDLNDKSQINAEGIDGSDDATKIYKASYHLKNKKLNICYHRSDTFGKAFRGSLVANCLETDLVVESGHLTIHHPPVPKIDFFLQDIMSIANKNELAVWIDSKNIDHPEACSVLADYLNKLNYRKKDILVEMPSRSYLRASELKKCTDNIKSLGHGVAYYTPTELSVSCAKELNDGAKFDDVKACRTLDEDLMKASESGLYSDISFDYSGIAAIQKLPYLSSYRWNTWNISPDNFDSLETSKFRMVILSNDDPNNM